MKNTKTTIFGLLAAIGTILSSSSIPKLSSIGTALTTISTFLLGAAAKDATNKN